MTEQQIWEYRVEYVGTGADEPVRASHYADELAQMLAKAGAARWELAATVPMSGDGGAILMFKRPGSF